MLIYYVLIILSNIRSRNDTFGAAAHFIIKNIQKLKKFSLEELSSICNVSPSTISRLTRMLEYRNFNMMTGYLSLMSNDYQNNGQIVQIPSQSCEEALSLSNKQMMDIIEYLSKNLNVEYLKPLIEEIKKAHHVCIVGSPIPQSAYCLQMELGIKGIETTAYIIPTDQYEQILDLRENDMIILYDGIAQESITSELMESYNGKPKLLFISPVASKQRIYNPDYFIFYKNTNFSMNLFSCTVITNSIITLLQQ